jgi:hypothetical protein
MSDAEGVKVVVYDWGGVSDGASVRLQTKCEVKVKSTRQQQGKRKRGKERRKEETYLEVVGAHDGRSRGLDNEGKNGAR